jgi:diguanylate cyclase (GGDEF)-like protein/PAS domain S-box-containing protein
MTKNKDKTKEQLIGELKRINKKLQQDITERKQAEEEIRKLSSAVEQSIDGIAIADLKLKFTYVNEAFARMHGYSCKEMIGMKIEQLHSNKQMNGFKKKIEQLKTKGRWVGEISHIRKDGTPFPTHTSVNLLNKGEPTGIILVCKDITGYKLVEEALRASEERYRELWDDAPVAYHTLDTKGIITSVNKTEAKMLGYEPQEMIGKSIFDFILPEQQAEAQKRFQQKLSGKRVRKAGDRTYITKDGSKIYVSIDDVLEYDSEGKVIGVRSTMVDMTEHKRMEWELRDSELQYRTTINSMTEAIHVIDTELRIILFNNAFKKELKNMGLETDITGQILFDVLPFLSDRARNEYRQVFESGKPLVTEEHTNIAGSELIAEVRKIPIWEDTKVVRIITVIRNITERKRAEETIRRLAYYDALTNLPNRTLFNNRLALELSRAQRSQKKASIMLLDLDRFKNVNDTLGHSFGDQLLQSVGKRLSDIVRSSDTVARMGGDEFTLLLPEITRVEDATKIAEKILNTIRKPFVINNHQLRITTSIGISVYPADGEDAETLIKNADIAMYKAKDAGRDNYKRYKRTYSS